MCLTLLVCSHGPARAASAEAEVARSQAVLAIEQQDWHTALAALERALAADPNDLQAYYYRGLVHTRLGRYSEARVDLKRAEQAGESPTAERARDLLARLEQAPGGPKPLSLNLSAGLARDSNVGLYADDQPLPLKLGDGSDQRWQLNLDARWRPGKSADSPWTLAYRLFHSRHHDLSAYDLLSQTLAVDWSRRRQRLGWGVNLQYNPASLDGVDFIRSQALIPHLLLAHTPARLSQGKLVWRDQDYRYPGLNGYDATQTELHYRHLWLAEDEGKRFVGLSLLREDARDAALDAEGYGLEAGLVWPWRRLRLSAGLEYTRRQFDKALPTREDARCRYRLGLDLPLRPDLTLMFEANHIKNASDSPLHEYHRSLYSLMLRWSL